MIADAPTFLTRREQELVALMLYGTTSTAALAAVLCVTENTVRFHLASVFQKLGVSDRAQVVAYAWQHGRIVDHRWTPNS